MNRRLAPFAALLLAGCVSNPSHVPQGVPDTGTVGQAHPAIHYEEVPGRDAQTVARMRATAPPQAARIDAATDADAEARLTSQGYVRIGRSHFPVGIIDRGQEEDARAAALRQATAIGADRVLLASPENGGDAAWIADYYVRFKLPFGATFRDLRAQELAALGATGGVAIGTVIDGTPASRANLIPGDCVIAVDGKPIGDRADFQDRLKRSTGRAVTLTVIRNKETLQRVVKLGLMADGRD
jgi:membrane-associated protease RseP (regulator of RpoE activity)